MNIIATVPPYAKHLNSIINHHSIKELRLNTIMPIGTSKKEILEKLLVACGQKPLWIDLKSRQLRINKFAYLPYAFVELSQKISVKLPTQIFFKDCVSEIVEIVDGNKLILSDRPYRVVGSGEPVNILDESLKIEGFLTNSDIEYIDAFKELGHHNYMLSFFESFDDVAQLIKYDDKAKIIAKIESKRGMDFVRNNFRKNLGFRLMAARDDLFINLGPTKIIEALNQIIKADNEAIVASQLFTSLENSDTISLPDLSDITYLKSIGYKNFMLSDGVCFKEKAFRGIAALLDTVL